MSRLTDVKNMVRSAGLEPLRAYQKHSSIHVDTAAPNGVEHTFFVLTKPGTRDDVDFLSRMKRFARANPAPMSCPDTQPEKEKEVAESKTLTVRKRTPTFESLELPQTAAAELTTKEVIRLSAWLTDTAIMAEHPNLGALARSATILIGHPVSEAIMRDIMDATDTPEPEHWHPLPDANTIVLKELSTMFEQLGYKPSRLFERLLETVGA
jgi:hypothetical protein